MTITGLNGFPNAAAAVLVALALVACSSPPTHFYSLSSADAAASTHTKSANPPFLIEMSSVGVPEQIAKSQLVIQKNATQVDVLEQERWVSTPADEIRSALSDDLTMQLGTIDVANAMYPPGMPVYRVSVNVQRFESWVGKRAVIDAVWSVRAVGSQTVMMCRTSVTEPVVDGYDALVTGHRKALDELASHIAAGVRVMEERSIGIATPAASPIPCPNYLR